MNRAEKAVEQAKLDREKAVLEELQEHYEYALNSINERLRVLQAAPETQSNVYHIQYQKTMQKQVSDILANLRANEYNTIDQYMHDAYTTGYVGTMYSLHNQGMPLTIPINQDAVVKAVQHNTKLTSPLYDELGLDVKKMQKGINRELSRGLSSGLTYDEIARNIKQTTKAPLARAKLIARTEGHRIHEESSYDAAVAAKAEGADLVKQWDATIDGDTRPNHKQLDTQIRELEEPFEVGTFKPMHPGDFGTAKEDCNCRCVSLKRARWALDEAELEEMKERAKQFGLDKSDEFAEFEKKYLKAAENDGETVDNSDKSGIIKTGKTAPDRASGSKMTSDKVEFSSDGDRLYEIKLSRDKKKAIISRGIDEETAIFATDTEDNYFATYVRKVQKKDGFYDVAMHGSDTSVEFFGERIDAYTLSQIVRQRKDYKLGMPVRLLSCSTGNTDNTGDCVAQIVANELGVIVEAPNDTLFAYEDGHMEIGIRNQGEMVKFYPRK